MKEYTYLGVCFSKSGLFGEAAKQFSKKSSIASLSTLGVINRAKITSFGTMNKLFQALVNSVTLYACEICGVSHLDIMLEIQNSFFKTLLGLPKCIPHYALRFEVQIVSIEIRVFKLILNLIEKVLIMENGRYPKTLLYAFLDLEFNN